MVLPNGLTYKEPLKWHSRFIKSAIFAKEGGKTDRLFHYERRTQLKRRQFNITMWWLRIKNKEPLIMRNIPK